MNKVYFEDQQYNGEHFTEQALGKGEYDYCTFSNCIFLNADLSSIIFSNCEFMHCDLSMAAIKDTAFREVKFTNCKLMGLRFDECNTFSLTLEFDSCVLNFSSFYKLSLKNTKFRDCKLEEVEFVSADLTNAVFGNCDLLNAVFEHTILESADFRTAINFSIDPEMNRIAKAKFSMHNIVGLLNKYKIVIS